MPFTPGSPKPINSGRKKGTPNRKSAVSVPMLLSKHKHDPIAEILKDLPSLEAPQRVRVNLELLSYMVSKPKPVEVEDEADVVDVEDENIETAELLQAVEE